MNPTNTVLLVDDDIDQLYVLGMLLEKENYEVVAAKSGKEALSLLADKPVDVVIADVAMPGMTGLDLARSLKDGSLKDKKIPVILITAGIQPFDFSSTSFRADAFCMKTDISRRLIPNLKELIAKNN